MDKSYKAISVTLMAIALYCFAQAFGFISAINGWFDALLQSVGLK